MTLIDFLIGFFLMNAMPHFVLGVWGGRILSLFGFGDKGNKAYGLLNFSASLTLFLVTYGWAGLEQNGMYTGALLVLVIYLAGGHFFRDLFRENA